MTIFLTGACGFIGFHLAKALTGAGHSVIGVDNLNDMYYDARLKIDRLKVLSTCDDFTFYSGDVLDKEFITSMVSRYKPQVVVHLAAHAGVRLSMEKFKDYMTNNIDGFENVIDVSCKNHVPRFIYASSSAVYGSDSVYADTKRRNEALAAQYDIETVGLRFFSVYGPYGRPDMAYWHFTDNIIAGRPLVVYNSGEMYRDYTHIDDAVNAVVPVITQQTEYPRTMDIGCGDPQSTNTLIRLLETYLEKDCFRANRDKLYYEVTHTCAQHPIPQTVPFDVGIKKFVEWYLSYNKGVS